LPLLKFQPSYLMDLLQVDSLRVADATQKIPNNYQKIHYFRTQFEYKIYKL